MISQFSREDITRFKKISCPSPSRSERNFEVLCQDTAGSDLNRILPSCKEYNLKYVWYEKAKDVPYLTKVSTVKII